jgi:hypothetical protein
MICADTSFLSKLKALSIYEICNNLYLDEFRIMPRRTAVEVYLRVATNMLTVDYR